MIAKNSVVKIQNLFVNHESRPVKANPVELEKITCHEIRIHQTLAFTS